MNRDEQDYRRASAARIDELDLNAGERDRLVRCFRKQAFSSRKRAKDAQRDMQRMTGEKFQSYHCPYCNHWHIGHRRRRRNDQ